MRVEEEQKNQENRQIIEALLFVDDVVEVPTDKGEENAYDHIIENEEALAEVSVENGNQEEGVALVDVDPPLVSARSNKSSRSEIPPTPTKEEVESSPRIGSWMACYDHDGNKYYYNTETEESSWDKPEGFIEVTAVEDTPDDEEEEGKDVVRIGDWTQATTDDGHVYWVHDMTGESTWDTPTDDSSGALHSHSPQGHSQSAPVLSPYGGNAKVSAGDYSIEL